MDFTQRFLELFPKSLDFVQRCFILSPECLHPLLQCLLVCLQSLIFSWDFLQTSSELLIDFIGLRGCFRQSGLILEQFFCKFLIFAFQFIVLFNSFILLWLLFTELFLQLFHLLWFFLRVFDFFVIFFNIYFTFLLDFVNISFHLCNFFSTRV